MRRFILELELLSIEGLQQLLVMRDQVLYRAVSEGFGSFRYNTRTSLRSIQIEDLRAMILEVLMDKIYNQQLRRLIGGSEEQ